MNLTKLVTDPRVDALYCTLASFCPLTRTARFAGFLARPHITESRNSGTLTREYSCRNSVRLRSTGFDHHGRPRSAHLIRRSACRQFPSLGFFAAYVSSSKVPRGVAAIENSVDSPSYRTLFEKREAGESDATATLKQINSAHSCSGVAKSVHDARQQTFNPGFRNVWHCSCSKNR